MFNSVVFAVCVLFGQINSLDLQPRIVGGIPADIIDFPHQVSVRSNGNHICSGAILDSDTILTAAHCINELSTTSLSIRAGSSFRTSGGIVIAAKSSQLHPGFNKTTFNFDIALLHLAEKLSFGQKIQPIRIFTRQIYGGWVATVTGWGSLKENGNLSSVLRKVKLPVQSRTICRRVFGSALDSSLFCAGRLSGGIDTCQGDGGSPLVYNGFLIGVTATGFGCARKGYPGLSTKVPMSSDWIFRNLNN